MSCLSLSISSSKKAWKSFTSKLQSRLHKLHRSKAIKKSRKRFSPPPKSTGAGVFQFSKLLELRFHRRRRLFRPSPAFRFRFKQRRYLPNRSKHALVYVDNLFKESVSKVAVKLQPPLPKISVRMKEEKRPDDQQPQVAGAIEADGQGRCASDEIWESLALASPQMRGIDSRAEEFIARFRSELAVQEIIARDL